jgi:hypothetical protein
MAMSTKRRGSIVARYLAAVVVVAGFTAACDAPESSLGPPRAQFDKAAQVTDHFYYHGSEKVYLEPIESRVVVAHTEGVSNVEDLVHAVAGNAGMTVARTRRLGQRPSHTVFDLSGNRDQAATFVNLLQDQEGIDFASLAYGLVEGVDTLLMLNEVIVRFWDDVSASTVDSLVRATGMRVVREPQQDVGMDEYLLAYPAGSDPLRFAAQLNDHPLVEWAAPNMIGTMYPGLKTPTDPYYGLQWYFKNSNNVDINIQPAWDVTLGGGVPSQGGIWVAVLDDGVDASHPDLEVTGYWLDAVDGNHNYAGNPRSRDSHGTSVAGIIVGQHDNQEGMAGGAPDVHLVPIRIYSKVDGHASDYDLAYAIRWAWYYMDSDVLNCSWYWPHTSSAVTSAINDGATQGRSGKGATIVFAAGNTADREEGDYGYVMYPAYLNSVIAVGALYKTGSLANYSPRGSALDIVGISSLYVAPPWEECSTIPDLFTSELSGSGGCNDGPPGDAADYTLHFGGTSAAAPQVASAAALMYSVDPSLHVSQVKSRLYANADYWGSSLDVGAGKLNVGRILTLQVTLNGPSDTGEDEYCTWTGEATGGVPPYSYKWYREYSFVGTGDTYEGDTGSSDFFLEVRVTDHTSTVVSDGLTVYVSGEPYACDA